MKYSKVLLFVFVMIVIFSACGGKHEAEKPVKDETVAENETEVLEQEPVETPQTNTVEEETAVPVPEEEEPAVEEISFAAYDAEGVWVYYLDENGTDLVSERLNDDIEFPDLLKELKLRGIMDEDTQIKDMVVGTATTVYEDGTVVASKPSNLQRVELDLSEEYMGTFEGSSGTKEDRLKVRALANTLLKYWKADEMVLRCNGEYVETEYCDFYDELYFTEPQ